jgi:palmitoyltransferase
LYCIIVNVTTDEWVNWEKYPEFQQEIPPEPGRPFPGRKFKNPYNKGILPNIIGFLKSKV